MDLILKFLIYSIRTLDGQRDTAINLLEALQKQSKEQFIKVKKRDKISKMREHQFAQMNEMKVFKKIFLKYKVMIIRAKISFSAFQKGYAINELIIRQIISSYNLMKAQKLIQVDLAEEKIHYEIVENISNNNIAIIKVLMGQNIQAMLKNLREQSDNKVQISPERIEELVELASHVTKVMKTKMIINDFVQSDVVRMCRKDKAEDIFEGNELNNEHQYNDSDYFKRQIRYRFQGKSLRMTLDRI